ncbi:MAG: AAA family ATPase [Elusimicrobiota bacterium]|jgi:hypothetical protein|nr:AAA family ATPase [Elusimicrobiota bacterium]
METQDKNILSNGQLQKLPIGIQEFKDLREQQCLYVDKTKQIYNFINSAIAFHTSIIYDTKI